MTPPIRPEFPKGAARDATRTNRGNLPVPVGGGGTPRALRPALSVAANRNVHGGVAVGAATGAMSSHMRRLTKKTKRHNRKPLEPKR